MVRVNDSLGIREKAVWAQVSEKQTSILFCPIIQITFRGNFSEWTSQEMILILRSRVRLQGHTTVFPLPLPAQMPNGTFFKAAGSQGSMTFQIRFFVISLHQTKTLVHVCHGDRCSNLLSESGPCLLTTISSKQYSKKTFLEF